MDRKTMKAPLESEIQRTICDWLALRRFFFWRSNNVPVFGRNNAGQKTFRSLPKYTPRGLPDIICLDKGKFIAIEVKRPGMHLRPEQGDIGGKIINNGGVYLIVHSLEELQEEFNALGL